MPGPPIDQDGSPVYRAPDLWAQSTPGPSYGYTADEAEKMSTSAYLPLPGGGYDFSEITYDAIVNGTRYGQAQEWQKLLAINGYLSGKYTRGTWDEKSKDALLRAMYVANSNKRFLTEMLLQGARLANKEDPQANEYTGPVTTTTTNENTYVSSRPTARAALTAALTEELGRAPYRRDVDRFLNALNKAERANPTITTTVSTTDPNPKDHTVDVTTTTTTEESKVDPQARAERFAEKLDPKEARRYQTGNYYEVIASMLGM